MDEFLGGLVCALIFVAQFLAVVAVQHLRLDDQFARGSRPPSRTNTLANCTLLALTMVLSFTYAAMADADQGGRQKVAVPGTQYEVLLGGAAREPAAIITRPLLAAIETWLSVEFGLLVFDRHPRIELVSPGRLAALRYGRLQPQAAMQNAGSAQKPAVGSRDTVAIYSDSERTIYLSSEWTGDKPADLSVLVHEMVHHAQNLAGQRFECPQEREKLAYAAQDRWLALFGHSLAEDFELDVFSLLTKTRCLF